MRLGSLQFHIYYEDGSEKYLYQNATFASSFYLYNKLKDQKYALVEKEEKVLHRSELVYTLNAGSFYINNPYNNLIGRLSVSEPSIPESTSSIALRTVQESEIRQTWGQQVRSHYEEMERIRHQSYNNEMERRAAQREADRRRVEEERNRPRTPWQRMRDLF